jgi:hypothetical protein
VTSDLKETVCNIEHTVDHGLASNDKVSYVNLVSAMISYQFLPKKPSLNIQPLKTNLINYFCVLLNHYSRYFSNFVMNEKDEVYYSVLDSLHPVTNQGYYSHFIIKENRNLKLNIPINPRLRISGFGQILNNRYSIFFQNGKSKYFNIQFISDKYLTLDSSIQILDKFEIYNKIAPELIEKKNAIIALNHNQYNNQLTRFSIARNYPFNLYKIATGNSILLNNLLYIIFNKGVYTYNIETDVWQPFLILPKATSILVDEEKNVWVSTMGEGIIKYSVLELSTGKETIKRLRDEPIKYVNGFKNQSLYVANSKNEIEELLQGKEFYKPDLIDLRFLETNKFGEIFYGGSNAIYNNTTGHSFLNLDLSH